MPNRAVVMSGGGAKGAFQVGALDYLIQDLGLDFQVIAGVSTGSLNAVVLSQASSFEELKAAHEKLKELWFGIRSERDIYNNRFLGKILVLLAKNSMYDPKPLFEKLRRSVSLERIASSRKSLRIGAVSLETGDYREVDQNQSHLLEWTLGSSSMPLFFPPVPVEGEHLVDGGVRSITPLQGAFSALKQLSPDGPSAPPDEMFVILASPLTIEPERREWKTGMHVGARAAGILVNQIYREDLDYALMVNEAVSGYGRLRSALIAALGQVSADALLARVPYRFRPPDYREVRLWTVVPSVSFSEPLQFEPQRIRAAFDAGREAARNRLDEGSLRDLIVQTSPHRGPTPEELLARTA